MNRLVRHGCNAAIAAALAASGGHLLAQGATTDAYAVDLQGRIVKDPFGLCWRTSQWTPAKAVAECDPDLVPRPVAQPRAVPPPAPAPTPAPAPAPAPEPKPAPAPVPVPQPVVDSDSDGDGVVDRLDKCPGSKPGARVDANGCEIQQVTVLKGVTFATNSATLTPQSMSILDETAATLARNPDLKAEVAGHTDNTGSAARNRVLSQQRAESVVRYLVSKGANRTNLTARGYGPDQPVADNRSAQGRSANRRVELRIQK
jgi:outer membrane protein OmpA-like peptidoglycan-associated protein